jgi:hypothetical protein
VAGSASVNLCYPLSTNPLLRHSFAWAVKMNTVQRVLVSLLLAATHCPRAAGYLFKPAQRRIGGNATFDFSAILPSTNFRGAISVKRDLFVRQEECAYPILCDGGTWCCPDGYSCVRHTLFRGLAHARQCATLPDCCPDDANCVTSVAGKCCPKTAQTCGGWACTDPGAVCCSDYVCPASMVCNELGGGQNCCEADEMKCPDACEY